MRSLFSFSLIGLLIVITLSRAHSDNLIGKASSDTLFAPSKNHHGEHLMDPIAPAIAKHENFDNTWPYPARYSEAPGFRMHYIDQGTGEETLLLLHGEPTWGYLFRHQIEVWSKEHRVIAVDHMGFGKSEAPQHRKYWLQDHIDNIERFVLDLDLQNITLVMHDFGGPTGMGLAIRQPDRIKRFISINGPTPLGQPELMQKLVDNASESPWFKWIMKSEENGTLEHTLGGLQFNILSTLKLNGFERNEIITDTWIRAYGSAFPTPRHAVGAIGWAKGFAIGAHRFEEPDADTKRALSKKPALALWGEEDKTLQSKHFLPLFRAAFPNGRVQGLPGAGHYSPEDAPLEIIQHVNDFISSAH